MTEFGHMEELLRRAAEVEGRGQGSVDDGEADGQADEAAARLLAKMQARIDEEEAGPWGRLRALVGSLPSWQRRGMGLVILLGISVGFGLLRPRADWALYPAARLWGFALALGASAALGLWLALRPLHRVGFRAASVAWVGWAGVLAVALLSSLPAAHRQHPESLAGQGWEFVSSAAACLITGLVMALVMWGGFRLLDRSGAHWMGHGLSAMVAAGVAANLSLHLHCPMTPAAHLWAGHALAIPLLIAGFLLARRVAAMAQSRSANGSESVGIA